MALRQWVLTVPFAWRKRLGYDGPLLSSLTRLFVKTVLDFYRQRGGGQSGAVGAVQRTSSDLKLNPHVHAVFLDGAYRDKEDSDDLEFHAVAQLRTRDVAEVLPRGEAVLRRACETQSEARWRADAAFDAGL